MALRRLFIAVALTTDARHALAATLGRIAIPGRPVKPPNWHVTLRFIGEANEPMMDRLVRALDEADLGSRFRIKWGGLGAFPRPAKATVLWVGLTEGSAELIALASRVESAVVSTGTATEDRPFRPHLTLSRIRPPQSIAGVIETFDAIQVAMPVDRVLLMESHLGGGGARYEAVESFGLD